MKIDTNVLNLTQAISQPQTGPAPNATSGVKRLPSDTANISQLASQLSADPDRIAQLEAAVAQGTYNVSPHQIAASLIDEMLSR